MQLGDRRTFRWVAAGLALALFGLALAGSHFDPAALTQQSAWDTAHKFFAEWWPPRTDGEFLTRLARGSVTTLATAFLGTLAALAVGLPLGILGSRILTCGSTFATEECGGGIVAQLVYFLARAISALFRSIPEVIWAFVFVRVYGLGALPAIAALGIAYGGMLGKVFSEHLEAVGTAPVAAIEAAGGSRLDALLWAVLPQAFGQMADYAMYRFECAIRASVLMGFVGAQGLGFELQVSYLDYSYDEVATEVIFLVAIVAIIEVLADRLRGWIA